MSATWTERVPDPRSAASSRGDDAPGDLDDLVGRIIGARIDARVEVLVDLLSTAVADRVAQRLSEQPHAGGGQVLLTVAQAAARLSLSRSTVYELIRRGELRTVRVGGARRVPANALQALSSSGSTRRDATGAMRRGSTGDLASRTVAAPEREE